jgi:hypothetical protein
MRRHLNYANVVATLALVFAMSGGALAAHHYLIVSTKQISPKVLKKLKGNAGPAGKTGAPGPQGTQGNQGNQGNPGAPGIGPAFGAFRDGNVNITSTNSTTPTVVATLTGLPAGSYAIQAKTVLDDENATPEDDVTCDLTAGGDFDQDFFYMDFKQTGDVFRTEAALQVLHTFSSGGSAQLTCYGAIGTLLTADHTKITAVQVSAITNKAVSG